MDSIIVISAGFVGSMFILKVLWSKAVKNLLETSDYDGIDNEDGTWSIWK